MRHTVVALCVVALSGCGRPRGAADLERLFDATERDLGGVRVDSDYSATYRFTNSTDGPLTVTGIKTSCGCVAADYDPSTVPAGGTRDITLNLSTHGQNSLGPLVKHATIEFGSGAKLALELKARLEADFDLSSRRLEFSADEPVHRITAIRRQLDAASFAALVLVADPERYRVVEDASASTADRREFEVSLKEASAAATLPDIYLAPSPDGTPLPFSTITCSREGPTLRPSAFVVVSTAPGVIPPAQKFEMVEFQSQPLRLTAVEGLDAEARRFLEVSFDPDQDVKSFQVALKESPGVTMTNLYLAVDFEAIDQSTTGRLLLPCHIVLAAPPGSAAP